MGIFELVAAIAGTIFGSQVLSSLVQGWFIRKKTSAEADAVLSEKAIMYNEILVKRIEKLELDIKEMRKEYEDKLDALRKENILSQKELSAIQKELELARGLVKPS